ncbi:GNAT family N-acetyltransferase (plasmid) [Rhizobium lusitanum]|uniref:GNAT family N-acetyltransferase n=1 Tax=Rhizobium lusitanum TaxID=293958 RepID=UPI00160CB0C4|nr:GNAT family N-acetyltransferase [Rhizobium lusitanum]QND44435.1 GNAT family N-acetyltransferase [Rhizobium lusitanum]
MNSLEKHYSSDLFYFLGFIKGSSVAEIACATILSVRNAKLPSYSVAYWTATEYYNRGYATEALVAVTAFAFSILSAKRVSTGHAITNTASQRVIEKAGFNRESIVALGYQMPKSEEFLDGVVYSLISASGLRNANHEFGQIEIDSLLLKGIEDSRCKFT